MINDLWLGYNILFAWLAYLTAAGIALVAVQFILYRFFNINLYKIITKKLY